MPAIALKLRRFARLASLGGLLLVLLPSEIASAQQTDIGAYKIADIAQISFGQTATVPSTRSRAQTTDLLVRLGQTFRF